MPVKSAAGELEPIYTADELRPVLEALRAAKAGDFSVRLPSSDNGILGELSAAFNDCVAINEKMAQEIVRVGRIVGREGRMTERAELTGAAGSWAESVDSINVLIEDLARPTTEVARVITAVADGDLTQKMALEIEGTPVKGEFLRIGATVNTMVDQLSSFAAEVTRVAREVGTEGKLGGQAEVKGVSGTWKDLTDNVNGLAGNLTNQVRNIALVTTAVANGDLSQKITVDAKGEILELKDTINVMVDQLNSFAAEVTRVAREVGTEGKLGGQAEVKGVSGTWKDLTDNVNSLAGNLTDQVRNIALVTTAVANGDLSQKITVDARGEILELKNTINVMVDQLNSFAAEVTRVAREVGTEGKLGGQAEVKGVSGTWKDLTDNVNLLAGNLTVQLRDVSKVSTAIANGDLTQKITVDVKGELLQIKNVINQMVDSLGTFAGEVTRVAKEVGTEGILGGQAKVPAVAGTWKDLTDNVNYMASNLTTQVRGIAKVVTAVANGDLDQKLVVEAKGEVAALADTINSMTDTLGIFAEQVTTVAREVGTEGKLGGQADVPGVAGTWKDLTDNVNYMASNLTSQVRNIALVTTAVANGDLSQKITVDAKGEILELKDTINVMVDQLNSFAAEVTRVAREVGTEGKLGGQAEVKGVSGTWKDLTDNVNGLAGNLTNQVRNIALVTTAVANGDLSQKITVDAKGEIQELKNTINVMVDQLNSFAAEVTRVAREVGTEGKLGGQAEVRGVSGTWKDLTDNVNGLAGNLTAQVRNIALVTTAVANGDLSQKITVDAKGEILELKNTINVMVDQLNSFAAEVTRVAREVGTEGKLGGQAEVKGISGTWKDLTDNVNGLAGNLTAQVRNIALVTTAVANGDLSQKITVDVKGEILELKNTINVMVDQLNSFAAEVTRVAREVGTEGKLGGQAEVKGVSGTWKDLTDNVNFMASNLTTQVRGIARVVTAVANGDLNQKLQVEAKGEVAALADTINSMTDTLGIFAEQVTTVAREVGTEGILGGQAKVPNVAGTWKDLTDNVNFMASNLTTQVRGIAKVVTAVADGDLTQKLRVDAKGEIAALADTINSMTDTLGIFAEQVTTVAREVGTEGKLGGQAKVPNVAGTWKDLTDNVNFMANILTDQVRAISEVATAVANGDLTRTITVEAEGEILKLKDNINQMIANLKDTTQKNTDQDWLKTNLARFSRMMQGQKNLESVSRLIMSELTPLVSANHGVFYINDNAGHDPLLKLMSSYAYRERKHVASVFRPGEGLVGQCALERKSIILTRVPSDYIQISSGLGEAPPLTIIVLPVLFEGEIMAVIELASFQVFSEIHVTFLDQLMESIGVVLNMITANMRTEELLEQSQSLTQELQSQSKELQSQQDQLKRSNSELEAQAKELEDKASLLAEQNNKVELKNREVELARAALEEKAEQLALSSKYKSEFLANMSHELRTPLNSMLILAKLLSDNTEGNLTAKQTEFAKTIYASGGDLLTLINEILDLSKVEAGKMEIDLTNVSLTQVGDYVERTFAHLADEKGLGFHVRVDPKAPPTIRTDVQRLQQVLRNLLGNAIKFTENGYVDLNIGAAQQSIVDATGAIVPADQLVAFSVVDTGIGISRDKHNLIFEAFQQADGTTSRKYGGTGLGLSISRVISELLGGRIAIKSEPGQGSVFTLYLPLEISDKLADAIEEASSIVEAPSRNLDLSSRRAPDPSYSMTPIVRQTEIVDDRNAILSGDRVVLIIEDDLNFAGILLEVARQQGFKGLVALDGETGLDLANERKPDAITLDLKLGGIDGWAVLDRLKRNPATRHIPVQVVSVMDRQQGTALGAISYLEKPVSGEALAGAFAHMTNFIERDIRELLIVEDDIVQRNSIIELISSGGDVHVVAVDSAEAALTELGKNQYDCVVLDLSLPGMSGLDLLKQIKQQSNYLDLPIIIYTSKDLSRQEEAQLKKYAVSIITKDARSSDRLLDETALFLHRVVANLPDSTRRVVEQLHPVTESLIRTPHAEPNGRGGSPKVETAPKPPARPVKAGRGKKGAAPTVDLNGRKVLIVDDDYRNIFALTSMLETYGMSVAFAESGKEGIDILQSDPSIELVFMDIMMPEMDGYQTTQAIRAMEQFHDLPIVALTAKAMEGDRAKCLNAGASDYITKPVDIEQLLVMLRELLGKAQA
ncbi:histidine kinase [Capsulimonas corticalis]|uniref:Circadian input-output histidine kinase CikA n=1 Tax=Capsulimonas corticalis TaxID=2219043 RepID=A0A402CY81_9BACT|nr:HAMP domain-containing protein [Capsulimonas corticalis]BDI31418.1 histidine kinase [Capsulimonas corticalis]